MVSTMKQNAHIPYSTLGQTQVLRVPEGRTAETHLWRCDSGLRPAPERAAL